MATRLAYDRPLTRFYRGAKPTPVRSRTMSRIRGKDTGPELDLRSAVWALGGRFRCHTASVPGRPDLCNQRARVAVFVDGCFWHGCPDHFRAPKTRRAYWTEKVRRNRQKRRAVRKALRDWTVLEFFECQLRADLGGCAYAVERALDR